MEFEKLSSAICEQEKIERKVQDLPPTILVLIPGGSGIEAKKIVSDAGRVRAPRPKVASHVTNQCIHGGLDER